MISRYSPSSIFEEALLKQIKMNTGQWDHPSKVYNLRNIDAPQLTRGLRTNKPILS